MFCLRFAGPDWLSFGGFTASTPTLPAAAPVFAAIWADFGGFCNSQTILSDTKKQIFCCPVFGSGTGNDMDRDYKPRKADEIQTGDMTAVLSVIRQGVRRFGRPAIYPDTTEGYERFYRHTLEFFDSVDVTNADPSIKPKMIPDIEAWCVYMGITRQTLMMYERRGGDWGGMIAYFKTAIAAIKKQLAFGYKIPPMVAIFDLTNNHAYYNTSEFRREPLDAETVVIPTLEEKVRQAGLVWDDESKEFVPER